MVGVTVKTVDVQAHVAANTVPATFHWQTSLGVDDRVATLSSLDKLRVLLLEDLEVLLSFPGPDAVGSKDKVHLFKCTLIGLGVQTVDHGQCNDVGNAEDVVSLLSESFESGRQDQCEPAITD